MIKKLAILISGQLLLIPDKELELYHYELVTSGNKHVCINIKRISKNYFSFDLYTYDFNKVVNKMSTNLPAYDVCRLRNKLIEYFEEHATWATFKDITIKRFYYHSKQIISVSNAKQK